MTVCNTVYVGAIPTATSQTNSRILNTKEFLRQGVKMKATTKVAVIYEVTVEADNMKDLYSAVYMPLEELQKHKVYDVDFDYDDEFLVED